MRSASVLTALRCAALVAWICAGTVAADTPGNIEGALLAASCGGCHRGASAGEDEIPSLDGLSAEDIVDRLSAYRSGELEGTLMNRLARGYSDAEIRALADFLRAAPE